MRDQKATDSNRATKPPRVEQGKRSFDPASIEQNWITMGVPARRVLSSAEQSRRLRGHENNGFLSEAHGFTPFDPPSEALPPSHVAWDEAARDLPDSFRTLRLRRRLDSLPVLRTDPSALPDACLLRAASLLAMLSHAYWYVETRPPDRLPDVLAGPWREIRNRLGREQEVLSYIDLIVYNWRLVDPHASDPRRVENMRLATPTVDNQEERIFYLTQFEILSRCSPIVGAVIRAQEAVARDDAAALEAQLQLIMETLHRVVRSSLLKINPNRHGPNYVDPVVWAKTVAPFAVPFQAGIQGPSGTSSPIFSLLDTFFGRTKHETFLGREIRSLRSGYPRYWRELLDAIAEVSVSDYVSRKKSLALEGLFKDTIEAYAGDGGFLGRHRMKVYGYLELAFKVGRSMTIGGFSGVFKDRTWDNVDSELEYARLERMASFPQGAHRGLVRHVEPTTSAGTDAVRKVVIDISRSGVRFEPGDRCAVLPENSSEVVSRTLAALEATGDEECPLTSEWHAALAHRPGFEGATQLTLAELLRFGKIRPVTPRVAEALHAVSQNDGLLAAIREHTSTRWELWDALLYLKRGGYAASRLIHADPVSSEHIARVVPPETFRPYSIASAIESPEAASAKELVLTVGRVRYGSDGDNGTAPATRCGTASNFLSTVAQQGTEVAFVIDHPPRFGLPSDPRAPIVMIAGGTGVSPFRAFIQARMRQSDAGQMWLLLAVRDRAHLHYREELQEAVASGRLRLEVAFSGEDASLELVRDDRGERLCVRPGSRRRIEDILTPEALGPDNLAELLNLFQSAKDSSAGVHVYICGHSRFAQTVHQALKRIVMEGEVGANSERREKAARVLQSLAGSGRYMMEIFADQSPWDCAPQRRFHVSDVIHRNNDESGYWLVIDGVVYDLTEFIELHPGGKRVLTGYAGMDATQGFLRTHAGKSEIDAMRMMHELGKLRRIDFESVRGVVTVDGAERSVALSALHDGWVRLAYLVVEMENALRNDQSLQLAATTRDEPIAPKSPYRVQHAIETHGRFLESYLTPLACEGLAELSLITRGMAVPDKPADTLMIELKSLVEAEEAQRARSLPDHLHSRLERILQGGASEKLEEMALRLWELEELDRRFLADTKSLLAQGLRLFEKYGSDCLEAGGRQLADLLQSVKDRMASYYRDAGDVHEQPSGKSRNRIPEPHPHDDRTTPITLVSSPYWHMVQDEARKVVVLTRTAEPVDCIKKFVAENDRVLEAFRPEHLDWGIVVDMRQAPLRNDPEFETAMRQLRMRIDDGFCRISLLVTSGVGLLQVNRLNRNEGRRTKVTKSEEAAIRFAAGQA